MRNLRNEKNKRIYTIFSLVLAMMMVLSSVAPIFATGDTDPGTGQPAAAAETNNQGGTDQTDPGTSQDSSTDGTSSDAQNPEGTDPKTDGEGEDAAEGEGEAANTEGTESPAEAPAEEPQLLKSPLKAQENENDDPEGLKPERYDAGEKDFGNNITNIDVLHKSSTGGGYVPVSESSPVKTGDDVMFIIDFTLDPGQLWDGDKSTNCVTFDIKPPIGNVVPERGIVTNSRQEPVGVYTITSTGQSAGTGETPTGRIKVHFTEKYVKANEKGYIDSTVDFQSSVDGWNIPDEGIVEYPFGEGGDHIEIAIQDDETKGDIRIVKTAPEYNSANGDATFSMDVTSTSGTATDVHVRDTMVQWVLDGNGSFEVTYTHKAEGTETETTEPIDYKSLTDLSGGSVSDGDDGWIMVLPKLGAGEKYTIKYKAKYPLMVNGKVSVKNTAIATSKDEDNKNLVSTSVVSKTLDNTPAKKTGKLVEVTNPTYTKVDPTGKNPKSEGWYEESGGNYIATEDETPVQNKDYYIKSAEGTGDYYIEWTVVINPNKVDIGNWTLYDTGLYNEGSNLKASDLKLVNKDTGAEVTLNGNYRPGDELDGTKSLHTFATGDSNAYILTYKTSMDFDDTKFEAKNTVKMDPPEGGADDEAENEPSSETPGIKGIDTEKDHDEIEVDLENKTAKITWSLTIDAKASAIPSGAVFTDTLGDKQTFDFEDNLEDIKNAVTSAFNEKGIKIAWDTPPVGDEKKASNFAFTILGIEDPDGSYEYVDPVSGKTKKYKAMPKGTKVTFKYKSLVIDFNPAAQTTYSNEGKLKSKPDGDTLGDPKDNVTYKPAINKYDPTQAGKDRHSSHYVGDAAVTYDGNKQTLRWGINVNLPSSYYKDDSDVEYVIVKDELDKGLTPVYLGYGTFSSGNLNPSYGWSTKDIKSATKDDPVEWSYSLPDWDASKKDVEDGYAKEEGEHISDATTGEMSVWYAADEGVNGAVYIKIPKNTIKYFKNKPYIFGIYSEIDKNWNWGTKDNGVKFSEFKNDAYLLENTGDDDKQVLDTKWTQDITYDENARAVVKGNLYNANEDLRTVPYRVVVNEEGKDLLEDGDTLEFKDTMNMTYPWGVSVTLIPESFKVYVIDSPVPYTDAAKKKVDNDKVVRRKDITDSVKFLHTPGKKSGDDWVITAKLPDETTLLVEYAYHMSGFTSGSDRVVLKNTSELTGIATDSDNGAIEDSVKLQRSSAVSDIREMTLAKVDRANNNKMLPGAQFDFYVFNGTKYIKVTTLTTDEDGELKVGGIYEHEEESKIHFSYNTAYRLVEVRPPKGYKLDATPVDFLIMNKNEALEYVDGSWYLVKPDEQGEKVKAKYVPDDFNGSLLGVANAYLYFENIQAHPAFKVEKVAAEDKAELGDVIEYTIRATNTGKDDAYDCTIVDILGKGLEYVDDDSGGTNDGKITTWKKDIMAGETVTIKFYARVVRNVKGGFVNSAYVEYNGAEGDVNSEKVLAEVELADDADGADTGDYTNMYMYVTLMAVAVIAIAYVYMRRRRDN